MSSSSPFFNMENAAGAPPPVSLLDSVKPCHLRRRRRAGRATTTDAEPFQEH